MTFKQGYFSDRRGRRTSIPHLFLGGLFGGNSGGSSSSWGNSTTTMNYDPVYTDLMHKVIGRGSGLMDTPYTPYTGQRFAPFTADQTSGFQGVRDMQGAWRPYTEDASAAYGRAAGTDAFAAGNPYVQQAAGMTTGAQAQQPYFSRASQTWPGAVDQYMNPYMAQVTDRIAQLGNRNLMENILPNVNDAFTRSGGAGFGRDRHAEFTQRAIRDTQDSILGTQANALAQGYNQGAQTFGADMSRIGQLGTAAGSQANADIGTRAGLGTTAGGLAATSKAGDVNLGQAQAGLGQTVQGSGMRDAQALVTSGQLQQNQNQNQADFNYQQFMNQMNWPFQMAQFGQGIGQGWQLPYTQTTNTQSGSQTTGPSGSLLGNIIGGVAGIGGLGAQQGQSPIQGIGNILGSVGGFFGFEEGGSVPRGHFAAGGHAPVVKGMREGIQRRRGAFGPPMPMGAQMAMPMMPQRSMPMRARGGHFKRAYADGGRIEMPSDWLLSKIWQSLPPEARHAYGSAGEAAKWLATEMNPAAAVRDMVGGSGKMGRGFFDRDLSEALEGFTDMAAGGLGLIPGWGLVPRGERALMRAVR